MPYRQARYITKRQTYLAQRAPTANDDGKHGAFIGQTWLDQSVTPGALYRCTAALTGAAVWREISEASGSGSVGPSPATIVYPITYSQFHGFAALSGSITLFTLLPGEKIISVDILQPSTTPHFAGPGVTACHLELGIAGTLAKYATSTDVFTAGSNSGLNTVAGYESLTASTAILLTAVSIGANLSVLTAGKATVAVTLSNPGLIE